MVEQPREPMAREAEELPEERRHGIEQARGGPANSPLALASFAVAMAAWFIIPAIGAVAAIVLGILAQGEIRRAGGRLKGNDLATAAIVVGGVQIGFMIFAVVGVLLAVPAG